MFSAKEEKENFKSIKRLSIPGFAEKTGFLCVALAAMELALSLRLASNSQEISCFRLPDAEIKGMHHHHTAGNIIFIPVLLNAQTTSTVWLFNEDYFDQAGI